jgi:acyl carrier protein
MTRDVILNDLTDIFRDVFFRDDILLKYETTYSDVSGWNSLRQIDIILCVEERFDLKFTSKEMDGLLRVGDFVDLIMKWKHER